MSDNNYANQILYASQLPHRQSRFVSYEINRQHLIVFDCFGPRQLFRTVVLGILKPEQILASSSAKRKPNVTQTNLSTTKSHNFSTSYYSRTVMRHASRHTLRGERLIRHQLRVNLSKLGCCFCGVSAQK
jgi:hypothetical protein